MLLNLLQNFTSSSRPSVARFHLKHKKMHFFLILLTTLLAAWPIVQVFLGISMVNLDGETSLALFEVTY